MAEPKPLVICNRCGRPMDIKDWMPAKLLRKENPDINMPHQNRSHPCWCGKLWLSSDWLVEEDGVLYYES